jgi:hypothetical protein
MNPYFYKWQRVEQDSETFVLRSSRPVLRWLSYWFYLASEAFCLGLLVSLPFLRIFGDIPTLIAVFGSSVLAFLISFFLNAKSDPYVTLELRFFCDQHKIELLGRSAFGFLVIHQFQFNESTRISDHSYEIDGVSSLFEDISIAFDANMGVVMENLSPQEMEFHMSFFLKVLPFLTTKEIRTTPNSIT